jgi:O-antigen/teichoic acid export membrane protein
VILIKKSESKQRMLERLKSVLGLDFHILGTLFFRGWAIIAGAVMVIFVPVWFSEVEQGYYYTFASLIALQVFFELGLNQVVVQIVGHEASRLTIGEKYQLDGPARSIDRLSMLVLSLRHWYKLVAIMFVILVGAGGVLFLSKQQGVNVSQWMPQWILLVIVSSVNLYLSPLLAVMEGCGLVGQVARVRLIQSVIGYGLTWIALCMKVGLYAVFIVPLTASIVSGYWLIYENRLLAWLGSRMVQNKDNAISWRTEIFPFQWKIGASWISGYLIFQLFTPMVFHNIGPTDAGRLGMAMAIFNALLSIGMSWVAASVPRFSSLAASGQRGEMSDLFFEVTKRSLVIVGLLCLIVLGTVGVLREVVPHLVERISELPVLVCLSVVTVSNCFIFSAASYMRAHKEEPMLLVSVVSGVVVLCSTFLASKVSVLFVMALYALITSGLTLPWTYRLLRRYIFLDAT